MHVAASHAPIGTAREQGPVARTLRTSPEIPKREDPEPSEVLMLSNVVSLVPSGSVLQTLADVAFMLSEGGRYPIIEKDVVAMCDRLDPRRVRVALHWAVVNGELAAHPSVPGMFVVGARMLEIAREGGFPDAA